MDFSYMLNSEDSRLRHEDLIQEAQQERRAKNSGEFSYESDTENLRKSTGWIARIFNRSN